MLDAKLPTSVSEGGRILTAKMSWDEKIQTLQSIAKDKGLTQIWDGLVHPWLAGKEASKPLFDITECAGTCACATRAAAVHKTAAPASSAPTELARPVTEHPSTEPARPVTLSSESIQKITDLITALDASKAPWQHEKYSKENSLWQGAALRRRAHVRRSNVSLGVCSVDLVFLMKQHLDQEITP